MSNLTHKEELRQEKNGDKEGKTSHKLMNNGVYSKTMEFLRNRIDVGLLSNGKYYSKSTSKPSYMAQKSIWQWLRRDS